MSSGSNALDRRILLLLPCNGGVRYGDYMLGGNWRIVYRYLRDLVDSGVVALASVDSCKPGVVLRGEEHNYIWCDIRPYWDRLYSRQPWRLELLIQAVLNDLKELSIKYTDIIYYINVKSYKIAVREAVSRLKINAVDAGPPIFSPLSFRAKRNLQRLRNIINYIIYNKYNYIKSDVVATK